MNRSGRSPAPLDGVNAGRWRLSEGRAGLQRDLVLASTAIVLSLASACGGQIAEPDGEGTNYGLGRNGSGRGSGSSGDEDETLPGRPVGGSSGGTTDDDDGSWGPGPSGSGGGSAGGYPGGTTTPNACFASQVDVCSDMASAKDKAAKFCAKNGYALAALTIDATGTCTVTCCDGNYPSPPPPPPQKCTWTKVGDGTTCMSNGEVEKRAYKACADMNLDVSSVSWSDDCKKGTRVAQVECCAY